MLRKINLLLSAALFLLAACQQVHSAATPTPAPVRVLSAAELGISTSAVLGMEDGFYSDAIGKALEEAPSLLAVYQETIQSQPTSAAEIIWMVSQSDEYNLDPKALLTSLYVENRLTWSADQGSLYDHMLAMALSLAEAQRNYQAGARSLRLAGGQLVAVEENSGAGMYMIAVYFAPRSQTVEELELFLAQWRAAYQKLFDQPAQRFAAPNILAATAPLVPFMRLPFDHPAQDFFEVNSFFDHDIPKNFNNSLIARFDGRRMDNGSFKSCILAVTCYSGHNAIDYSTPLNTPLVAVANGKVIYRNDSTGGLMIQHNNGYITLYWHMERIDVKLNQTVSEGQLLGVSGNRGQSTGPHLHFGLRRAADSVDIDPYGWWTSSDDPWVGRWAWKGDLTADNREAQAQLFYNKYWYRDPNGYRDESWYTMSVINPGSSTNWAIWGAYITKPGTYTVSSYWPKTEFNSTGVTYQIWNNSKMYSVTISQADDGNRFVPLGNFEMQPGPSVVILRDLTQTKSQRVYFDAIRWRLNATQPVDLPFDAFLPWVQSSGSKCTGIECLFP